MHNAPAVSYPVGRSRFQGWLLGLTCLLGVATAGLWQGQPAPFDWRQSLFATGLLCTCVFAARTWWRSPEGNLRWDGQTWGWTTVDASFSGFVSVQIDFQSCLVLSLRTDDGSCFWLWPERRSDMALWDALRRAVFARGATGPGHPPGTDPNR